MEIRLVKNKEEWEKFIFKQPYSLFVQSFHYGEFYEALGEQGWIFGIYDGEELVGGSLCVSVHAKRGDFLFLPHGPILPLAKKLPSLELLTVFFENDVGQMDFTGEYKIDNKIFQLNSRCFTYNHLQYYLTAAKAYWSYLMKQRVNSSVLMMILKAHNEKSSDDKSYTDWWKRLFYFRWMLNCVETESWSNTLILH